MENTPVLLVPGFFLYVLMRLNNKRLTNSDGIRFIVSVFLTSLVLLIASHYLTNLISEWNGDYTFVISQHALTDFRAVIKDVEVSVYLNSFLIALVWFLLSKLDLKYLLNLIIKKKFFEDLVESAKKIKENGPSAFWSLPLFRILLIAIFSRFDSFVLLRIRKFASWLAGILFLGEDSVHCFELDKLVKHLILITLKSEKVYIGRVESADINIVANTDDILKIVPIFSGYRDDHKKVHITTEYELEAEGSKVETSILIFKREIVSISNFDRSIAKDFINRGVLLVDKKFSQVDPPLLEPTDPFFG